VLTIKSENVWDPVHPLKSKPTVIVVTVSFGETIKAIGMRWEVWPCHSPTFRDAAPPIPGKARATGKTARVHALATRHAAITHSQTDFGRRHALTA
jgi:hypothetical protein